MKHAAVLPLLLKELKLSTMARMWEPLNKEVLDKGWSAVEYLSTLCDYEIAEREKRRLNRLLRESQLPSGKSLESFNFRAVPTLKKDQILGLGSGEVWIKDAMNVLIFGPSGVGKTHLAAGIGEKLVQAGNRVLFIRTTELLQKLAVAQRDFSLPKALDRLDKYDCLILDDFGYVQKNESETRLLFELICERYERRSLLITCNQPFQEWDQVFEDKKMAIAAVDRLVHHATLLDIQAESFRKREAIARLSA